MGNEKSIPLRAYETGGVDRKGWPVTQGVPFPDGELPCGAAVCVVDEDGTRLPTQSIALTTWDPDFAWVKWLLVDFQCDLSANETRDLRLEYGERVESPQPTSPVTVSHAGNRTRIDTGELRLDLRHDSADFVAALLVPGSDGWRNVLRGAPGPFLYLVGSDGTQYDSITSARPPRIEIEEPGPLHACVAIKGFHAAPTGIGLCPYTLRLHLYAGQNLVRLFHTFVFDQNPDELEFRGVGLRFPVDVGDEARVAFGGETGARWASRWTRASLLQTSDIAHEITRDGAPYGSGEKARGWASVCGRLGSRPRASTCSSGLRRVGSRSSTRRRGRNVRSSSTQRGTRKR